MNCLAKEELTFVQWIAWCLSNMYRYTHPDADFDASYVHCLSILILCQDEEVVEHTLWACKYFAKTEQQSKIVSLVNIGLVEHCVKVLQHSKCREKAQDALVGCLSHISTVRVASNTERVISAQLFSLLKDLLQNGDQDM